MFNIPKSEDLKGKKMAFAIQRRLKLAVGTQNMRFGALLDAPFAYKQDEKEMAFQYTGWLGDGGKTEPIAVQFDPKPGKGKGEDAKDKPAMRIFVAVDGVPVEIVALWKQEVNGKTFYTGKQGSNELAIWPHTKPETDPETESF